MEPNLVNLVVVGVLMSIAIAVGVLKGAGISFHDQLSRLRTTFGKDAVTDILYGLSLISIRRK